MIQLTLQQAAELGEHGIRANCICPGPVRTKLAMAVHTQEIIDAFRGWTSLADRTEMLVVGLPTDISDAIRRRGNTPGRFIIAAGGAVAFNRFQE